MSRRVVIGHLAGRRGICELLVIEISGRRVQMRGTHGPLHAQQAKQERETRVPEMNTVLTGSIHETLRAKRVPEEEQVIHEQTEMMMGTGTRRQ